MPNIQPKIQKLSALLTQQIAAGEVIARPASVVKELLENSLDAGATRIILTIQSGGKKSIQVEDNGIGIDQEELILALAPHATSKIKSVTDLDAVESFGFRGEALASITGVARIELISKPKHQITAWKILSEPGRTPVLEPSATTLLEDQGTCLQVKDLFYQLPARKKFLKTDRTEQLQIESIFKGLAIYYTQVSWVLKIDQTVRIQALACAGPEHRYQRMTQLYGEKFTRDLKSVECELRNLKLTGWILDLNESYPNTDIQWVYVNGRVVRDRMIQHAIRQAVQMIQTEQAENSTSGISGLRGLESGYLAYCLCLSLPSSQVDVNVHPMKEEVRFENSRAIHDLVFRAILSVYQDNQQTFSLDETRGFNRSLVSSGNLKIESTTGLSDMSECVLWDRFLFLPSLEYCIDLNIYLKLFFLESSAHAAYQNTRYSELSEAVKQDFSEYFLKKHQDLKKGYRRLSIKELELWVAGS